MPQQASESKSGRLVCGCGELVDQYPAPLAGERGRVADPAVRDHRQAGGKVFRELGRRRRDFRRVTSQETDTDVGRGEVSGHGVGLEASIRIREVRPRSAATCVAAAACGVSNKNRKSAIADLAASKKSSISPRRYQLPRLPEYTRTGSSPQPSLASHLSTPGLGGSEHSQVDTTWDDGRESLVNRDSWRQQVFRDPAGERNQPVGVASSFASVAAVSVVTQPWGRQCPASTYSCASKPRRSKIHRLPVSLDVSHAMRAGTVDRAWMRSIPGMRRRHCARPWTMSTVVPSTSACCDSATVSSEHRPRTRSERRGPRPPALRFRPSRRTGR